MGKGYAMNTKTKSITLGFTNKRFQPGVHICFIYRDEQERQKVIAKFLKSGYENHEKIGYFTDIMTVDELIKWVNEIGIDLSASSDNKQFVIKQAVDHYCPDGCFIPQNSLNAMGQYYDDAKKEGFSGARVTGETSWQAKFKKIQGIDQFIIYETLLNKLLKKHPVTTMCQYDAKLFSGAEIFDILQVHPYMIVHGQVVENPAYLRPDEFLKVVQSRK